MASGMFPNFQTGLSDAEVRKYKQRKDTKMLILKDVVKIAVHFEGTPGILYELNQKEPLGTIVQNVCDLLGVTNFKDYSLKLSEKESSHALEYVNDKNRDSIKNGSVLYLVHSPANKSQELLDSLTTYTPEALESISQLSSDAGFAEEFIKKDGIDSLLRIISLHNTDNRSVAHTLMSIGNLMDHGHVHWGSLPSSFIETLLLLTDRAIMKTDLKILQCCLSLLENLIVSSEVCYSLVRSYMSSAMFVRCLSQDNVRVQHNALAVVNALFMQEKSRGDKGLKQLLWNKETINVIVAALNNGHDKPGADMLYQFYMLQVNLLDDLKGRMNEKLEARDFESFEKIKVLKTVAFGLETESPKQEPQTKNWCRNNNENAMLGFKNVDKPWMDFREVPPGSLALDCMVYYAENYPINCRKLILENQSRDCGHHCPFAQTSVRVAHLLCEILKVGEGPSEQSQSFYTMFFTRVTAFEEFFCICIELFFRTWKEMRASVVDHDKVLNVVREKVCRCLRSASDTFEQFKNRLNALTYTNIAQIWQQERMYREELESQSKPIIELREKLAPTIVKLVATKRRKFLMQGTRFMKFSAKQLFKDEFWYCRLSPNGKYLHYGDCGEKEVPKIENLKNVVIVSDIRDIVTGKECPHNRVLKMFRSHQRFLFSILLEYPEPHSIDFAAPDEETYNQWIDGLHSLMRMYLLI